MWSNANPNDEDEGVTHTFEAIVATPHSQGWGFPVAADMEDDALLVEDLYFMLKERKEFNKENYVERLNKLG